MLPIDNISECELSSTNILSSVGELAKLAITHYLVYFTREGEVE